MKLKKLALTIFLIFLFVIPFSHTSSSNSDKNNTPGIQSVLAEEHSDSDMEHEAAHPQEQHINLGEILPLWSCIPFALMLLSIAFLPLFADHLWHNHFGKISSFWAATLALPFLYFYKGEAAHQILHIILADYIPFIILLWALYTISGGILLKGSLRGTPVINTLMILIGTILASWMGTTGAAMLLIRPFLRANNYRKNRTFMVVFFIFLIGNIGGALTPLGDPPLFLGFLHGVSFFWTIRILPHMLVCSGIILFIYFFTDMYFYKKENPKIPDNETKEPLKLVGIYNFIFLGGVIAAVLASGILDLGTINTFGVLRAIQDWGRDFFLILMGALSLLITPQPLREENEFSWFPIVEVACLFIGIFITMIPCLLLLKAGPKGSFAFLIEAVKEPYHYFWVTGMLSAFLDNAPTYLTFFNTALGSFYAGITEANAVPLLMTEKAIYLKAISTGAVFFGAFSYIGNAPNFMVKSIAEETGTPMPSFFGYIFKYSIIILIPCFIIITIIFF